MEENKLSVGHGLRRTAADDQRADSKSSTGQLIRKSRGQGSGKKPGLRGTNQGSSRGRGRIKGKTRGLSNVNRAGGASRYAAPGGYR